MDRLLPDDHEFQLDYTNILARTADISARHRHRNGKNFKVF